MPCIKDHMACLVRLFAIAMQVANVKKLYPSCDHVLPHMPHRQYRIDPCLLYTRT